MSAIHQTATWNQHSIERITYDCPIPDLPTYFTTTLHFCGPRTTYTPAALDSMPPVGLGIAGRLVLQSPLEHQDADLVRYSRTFALPPPVHYIWETYTATFPAMQGALLISNGRVELVETVTSRVRYTYHRMEGYPFAGGFLQPDYSIDTAPVQPDPVFTITTTDGARTNVLSFTGSTTPTAQDYISTIVGTEIAIESDVDQWMGNIYVVKTRFVIAK